MGPFHDNEGFQLQYPMGAGDTFFPEAIKFTFIKRLGVSFQAALGNLEQSNYKDITDEYNNAVWGGTLNEVQGHFMNIASGTLQLKGYKALTPSDRTRIKNQVAREYKEKHNGQTIPESTEEKAESKIIKGLLQLGEMAQSIRTQNAQLETLGSVYLNMPNNIALSEEVGWGGESLGVVGALTKGALKHKDGADTLGTALLGAGAGAAGNILAAVGGGIAGRILSKIPGISGMGGLLVGAIAGETIQRGAEAAFSVKQNPYMEMMFSGIGFRAFKFDFVFRARNKSEINMVGKIIQMFRQHSRPSWQGGALGKSFMKYPQEYKIQFLTDTNGTYMDNLHLPQLKPCVCSNVETNFTPDNIWSAYEGGAPVSITLGLTFQEKELVMADDIAKEWPSLTAPEGRSEDFGSDEFGMALRTARDSMPTGSNQ